MRHAISTLAVLSLLAAIPAVRAADQEPAPEISRAAASPQANGQAHTLRTIPEACLRLQGEFTGDPAAPYRFQPVRTSAACQARARVVDARKAGAPGAGWILNDASACPAPACPGQQAVVRVWRQDGRRRHRRSMRKASRGSTWRKAGRAKAGQLAALPVYAVAMSLQGKPCR